MRSRGWVWLVLVASGGCSDEPVRRPGPSESDRATGTFNGPPSAEEDQGKAGAGGGPVVGCPPQLAGSGGTVCVAVPHEARPPPVSLYLMLDRSGSMAEQAGSGTSKWSALTSAFGEFLQQPPLAELSVAAQFFPAFSSAELCAPQAYAQPLVSLAPVSQVRTSLLGEMQSQQPDGSTPTWPALSGALDEAQRWARNRPDTTAAVVLATDGIPSSCDPLDAGSLAALASEAAQARPGQPAVATFVVGILGDVDLALGASTLLDAVAQAGGTGAATIVTPGADLAQTMAAALRSVANRSVACSFALPEEVTSPDDLARLNVTMQSDACSARALNYAPKLSACQGDGWAYNVDPSQGKMPTHVLLCPTSCQRYRAGATAQLELGCATQGWPTQ